MVPADVDGSFASVCVDVEPYHLDRPFDYAVGDLDVTVGQRVEVVFNGRVRRGVVLGRHDHSEVDPARVKPVRRTLGPHAWATADDLALYRWAAERWGATLADVLRHALPTRVVAAETAAAKGGWFPVGPRDVLADLVVDPAAWARYDGGAALLAGAGGPDALSTYWRPLPDEDVAARLVDLAVTTLGRGRDTLLVVPDAGSRVADDVVAALGQVVGRDAVVDARGSLGNRARYTRWLTARTGRARVVVGERGVALWPLQDLGLAVVLDEANPALKERRSPRHHSREVLLERARRVGGTGVLVGTVPSAAAWRLLRERRLTTVVPPRREERAASPTVRVLTGGAGPRTRLFKPALAAVEAALTEGRYAVVLAGMRGEGRGMVCVACGEMVRCPRCERAPRPAGDLLLCEGCGWRTTRARHRCAACRERRFRPLIAGAQQTGDELARTFPDATVAVLEGYDQPVPPAPAVLVVTRGSVMDRAPGDVAAVVLPGFDGLLRRPELDAAEDALRLACRLADWTVQHADDHVRPGARRDRVVLVQTGDEDHPTVQALVQRDPGAFWRAEAAVRGELRLPPNGHLLRLDAPGDGEEVADAVEPVLDVDDRLLGPVPGAAGRASLLVKTTDRVRTLAALRPLRLGWSRDGADVRLDVDPVDVR